MTIDKVKQIFDFICNTYEKGANVNGDEFTLLFNVYQTNYYDFLIGHVEQYQYGRPVARVGMNMTESISTKLSPFIKRNKNYAVAGGVANKPSDFGRLIAMRKSDGNQVARVEHDRLASRLNSVVIPPATNPIYVEFADTWEIYPASTATVDFEYYPTKPDDVKWNYTTASGREVYNSTGSIDPKWKDYDVMAIISRMLNAAGVSVDDGMVMQYSQKLIQSGE